MKSLTTALVVAALAEAVAFAPLPYAAVRKPTFTRSSSLPCRAVGDKSESASSTTTLETSPVPARQDVVPSTDVTSHSTSVSQTTDVNGVNTDEKESETKKLLQKVKDAGIAGVISYAAWEVGFWAISVPVVLFGYYEFTGHWPDLANGEDIAKLSAEAFAFVNFARFAVPLRIGLALSTTPWIQSNIVDKFMKDKESNAE